MLIYIAAPYYHADPAVTQERMERVYETMGQYIKAGDHVLTPLFMHEVVTRHELPGDYVFWENYCLKILGRCDKMIVLKLDGWDKSRGIAGEIEFCAQHGIPVEYMDQT